ncbi:MULTISPECIES: DUF4867 family protein [Paenibacillus]|uniref:Uncharacterized protein DUF4867 n=1 Tax=Paenibacillus pabuli TaxID=1472 RepID=A0A855YEJ2_9BACL|nr:MULTISPECIES: DUF4867 family protein [Paenibacillus]PWW42062.1 uncharacterized protein DUF4867 [Paenibacillus pabuli]PXW07450.1 uncharacterized protein DUF4867 [Paenibacillus taichungensis]
MTVYERLRQKNNHLSFYHVQDTAFLEYGNIIEGFSFDEVLPYMNNLQIPQDQNEYVASVPEMELSAIKTQLESSFYGEIPVQIGYCNGANSTLNGLEYHKSSEINVAVTDMVLILGKVQDIKNNTYDSAQAVAFYVPQGTAIELYGTTLHFGPCKVEEEGFKTVVILPAGTNEPLNLTCEKHRVEDRLLFMKNKWLLVHPEREVLVRRGAHVGIEGENIRIYT